MALVSGRGVPPTTHPHRLLVEGRDDVMVIGSFLKRKGFEWPATTWLPFIHDSGGVEPLLEAIPVAAKASYRRLGIVLDADENASSRWDAIRNRFAKNEIEVPRELPETGLVMAIAEESPGALQRLGVWVMPDNGPAGELEDFVSTLVPSETLLWPHAQKATDDAIVLGAPMGPDQRTKGEIHSFLAWQEHPGVPMGAAIAQRILGSDGPLANRFLDWFRKLYETR